MLVKILQFKKLLIPQRRFSKNPPLKSDERLKSEKYHQGIQYYD